MFVLHFQRFGCNRSDDLYFLTTSQAVLVHLARVGHMITCDRGHEGSSGVTSGIPTSCRSNHPFIFSAAEPGSALTGGERARKWKREERLHKVQRDHRAASCLSVFFAVLVSDLCSVRPILHNECQRFQMGNVHKWCRTQLWMSEAVWPAREQRLRWFLT